MSHSVKVTVVADQHIIICGKVADIYKLRSVTLDGFGQAIGYVEETPKEAFNCSEDYFKDVTGDNLLKGDTISDAAYQTYECKVCGWRFLYDYYSEAGVRLEVVGKMRDHVHLKHGPKKEECEHPVLLGHEDCPSIPKGFARCQDLSCREWIRL